MPTRLGATEIERQELRRLLIAALDLLSAYAASLNAQDGGNRKIYKTVEEWKADVGPE